MSAALLGAGISNMANALASQIGTQQKSLSGSLIYRPPVPIAQTYVDSCLGYIPSVGKRQTANM